MISKERIVIAIAEKKKPVPAYHYFSGQIVRYPDLFREIFPAWTDEMLSATMFDSYEEAKELIDAILRFDPELTPINASPLMLSIRSYCEKNNITTGVFEIRAIVSVPIARGAAGVLEFGRPKLYPNTLEKEIANAD